MSHPSSSPVVSLSGVQSHAWSSWSGDSSTALFSTTRHVSILAVASWFPIHRRAPEEIDEHEESSHDAESNPCFDEISDDDLEEELEPWVDYTVRATHKADDLLAASRITSWILRQSKVYWKQARMLAEHHEDRWTKLVSNWNSALSKKQTGEPETTKTGQEVGRRHQHLLTHRQIQQRQPRSLERRDLARLGGRQLEIGC